eukprot:764159-Hanusia_phi.AAC.1
MYGSGFDVGQIIICKFGLEDDSESIARLASSTSLQCFSRAGEAGNVTIGIGNSDVGFTYSKTPFELVEVTRIIRVYPTQVPVNTDTQITIEGFGLSRSSHFICWIDSEHYFQAIPVSLSELVCTVFLKMSMEYSLYIIDKTGVKVFASTLCSLIVPEVLHVRKVYRNESRMIVFAVAGPFDIKHVCCCHKNTAVYTWSPVATSGLNIHCQLPKECQRAGLILEGSKRCEDKYLFEPSAIVKMIDIFPSTILSGTWNTIRIFGSFSSSNAYQCVIADQSISATKISDREILCKISPLCEGKHELNVFSDTIEVLTAHVICLCLKFKVQPSLGPMLGGTLVTLTSTSGLNMSEFKIRVGETPVSFWTGPSSEFYFQVPPTTPGWNLIAVQWKFEAPSLLKFFTTGIPKVTAVHPPLGEVSEISPVKVLGEGFISASTKLKFGLYLAHEISVVSSSFLLCKCPRANIEGTVPISITTNEVDYFSYDVSFTFMQMPRIFAVFPTSVPLSGGVGISIFGTNLHSDRVEINVLVGRKKAITTLLTSTVLMSLCPELDEVANLSVALSVGNTLIEGDRIPLHVSQEVSLLRVVPTLSYDGSQVTLTLHGAGFHERMIASIGNKRLSCLVNDVQSAVCESEALSLGNSWLHILGSGIEPVLLQVLERPKVYSVQPTEMSKAESGTITLFGQ